MTDTILQIVYILIAIAMAILILLQRGAGAQAGSGFGAGASGTVFGSRGSTNFLAKTTQWLAFGFFCLALFMAWKAVNINKPEPAAADIGLMGSVPSVPETKTAPAPVPAPAQLPAIPTEQPGVVTPPVAAQTPAAAPEEKK